MKLKGHFGRVETFLNHFRRLLHSMACVVHMQWRSLCVNVLR